MQRSLIQTLITLTFVGFTTSSSASPSETLIFTTADYPVTETTVNTSVFYLDAPEKLTAELFNNLPDDSKSAERQARKAMSSSQWQQHDAALREAFKGALKAWSLGIEKIPAVVMDGRFVVYGTTNIELARKKLSQYQGGH